MISEGNWNECSWKILVNSVFGGYWNRWKSFLNDTFVLIVEQGEFYNLLKKSVWQEAWVVGESLITVIGDRFDEVGDVPVLLYNFGGFDCQ